MTGSGPSTPDEEQRAALRAGYEHADLTLEQLWLRYFGLGGHADLLEVEAHLAGLVQLAEAEHDILALAVNERLDELVWQRRVPYRRVIRARRPTEGPFAAIVDLLEAGPSVSPDRLPELAAVAGRTLGVQMTIHLVDHEQLRLIPLARDPGAGVRHRGVDSTLAGRAFRTVQILSSEGGGRPVLWVPIQDGADRLGVLEVGLAGAADLHDPALREQCLWIAAVLGHLIASKGQYSDHLEALRRERPRMPSAELIWQQVPPLTAATSRFVVAGMLQPSHAVGGDAFDYSLSDESVTLAIFDAMGHGLAAGLMAGAVLAAYRSARRAGRGLLDQAGAIDAVVASTFPGSAFVTGVLTELDVRSGALRYVNAGHPPPLLLRGGRVVKTLTGGGRIPFGLDSVGVPIGEEALQPGDWLALHTDGITEARDADGAWFGEQRLVDFLTHAAAAGQPPPETVRRLTRAVLDHQQGLLQDDASILLACWSSGPSANCVDATVHGA